MTAGRNSSNSTAISGITGVVLAGGLSSRMGNDKAGLCIHGDGQPDLLTRACSLLATVADEVWISGNDNTPHVSGCFHLYDERPKCGPAGGILTALRAAQGPVLVLSCDLPFMESAILTRLVEARSKRLPDTLMTTYVQAETGHVEALVSIYEFAAMPYFEAAIDNGHLKVSRVVPEERQVRIPYTQMESLPFFNVNYPADLEMARRILTAL